MASYILQARTNKTTNVTSMILKEIEA